MILPKAHVERVCRPGQDGCCAYLASRGPPEYFCAKGEPDLRAVIRSRLAEGTLGARGDNCSGPPDYREYFTCPRCGAVSHHPTDAKERYCGRCHAFVDDPTVKG